MAYDLDDLCVLDLCSQTSRRLASRVWCRFEYADFDQLVCFEGVAQGLDACRGYAFLADMEEGLERMGKTAQVSALLRGQGRHSWSIERNVKLTHGSSDAREAGV